MSTPIKTPSRTVLADGQIVFIIYRRDVASSAPERVTVRVIAKIMRAMTFDMAGQASLAKVEDAWTIRNVSYELRVAPLSEGPEMLMIRTPPSWPRASAHSRLRHRPLCGADDVNAQQQKGRGYQCRHD
jgi:hypothetical protein